MLLWYKLHKHKINSIAMYFYISFEVRLKQTEGLKNRNFVEQQKHSYICKALIKKFDITINVTDHCTPGTQLLHTRDFFDKRNFFFCKSVTTHIHTYISHEAADDV